MPAWQHPYLGRFINERNDVTREVEYPGENHLITVGPPGRGKTTGLLVPNVHLRRSMIFIDIKGEIAAITARYRAQFGPVVVINPYGLLTGPDASAPGGRPWLKSQGFNPLRTLDPGGESFVDDCTKLAQGLVRVDAIDPQKHFAESARILVSALIMWEVLTGGRNASLAHVRTMLCEPLGKDQKGNPIGLSKTVTDICAWADNPANKLGAPVRNKMAELLHATNEIKSIRNSARTQTDFLDSPPIAADLSKGTLDFARLKSEVVTVYLILPISELDTHSNWLRLLIVTAVVELMRTPRNRALPPPIFMLDEFAHLGHLPIIKTGMGAARAYGILFWLYLQSLAQLRSIYHNDWQTFTGTAGMLSFFAPNDTLTAEEVSKFCGQRTAISRSRSLRPGEEDGGIADTPQSHPLFRPEELRRMPRDEMLCFADTIKFPFLTKTPGYFKLPIASELDRNPYA